ncbi:MAG: PKD domain-containing protein [Candidatus Thermoplasmatota archaeon]|jgi:hypothetical protein|nr:PKD domain-containing protein [Candidatus Thermoplasmatota archaeon]
MKKKLVSILVCMLMCVTTGAVTATQLTDEHATPLPQIATPSPQDRAMWDVLFQFDAGGLSGSLYLVGIGFDGTYFYCPEFATGNIHKFNADGTYVGIITVPGVPNLIDLTYDGTYFYGQGQSPTNVIYKMDFATQTLIGTIPSPHAAWNIAYDAEHDGFWIGQWQSYLDLIDRSGVVIDTITPPDSMLGMAWDPWTNIEGYDGPFLWISTGTSTGMQNIIKVIDLATKTLIPGIEHNVAAELGEGMAGGLELSMNYQTGLAVLIGMTQGTTNDYAFGYELSTTNAPPLTPAAPTGPDTGVIGIEYSFQALTTDPESDQVYYMFDWGDGTMSDWIGPFASGAPGSTTHTWDDAGTYEVKAKAKDVGGGESGWSEAHSIIIYSTPVLEIGNITGGLFKVKAVIKNTGFVDADHIQWTMTLVGGAFMGKEAGGTILAIPAGEERTVTSGLIIGFGKTVITVTATCEGSSASKDQNATILLFFIKIKA